MKRRRIAQVATYLILGAATSVAVAWACVASAGLVSGRNHVSSVFSPVSAHRYYDTDSFGIINPSNPDAFFDDPRSSLGPYGEWRGTGLTYIQYLGLWGELNKPIVCVARELPRWASRGIPVPGSALGPLAESVAAGWPCRCVSMTAYVSGAHRGSATIHLGTVRVSATPSADTCGCLPVRPIWRGLTMDTAVWSAAWAVVLTSPGAIRRRQRRRRGVCEACGYDLRGQHEAGCPECGWGRT